MIRRLSLIAVAAALVLALALPARAQSLKPLPFSYLSAVSTNSTLVAGNGQNILKWIVATNTSTTNTYYLKLYNKATAPTCGTDTPVMRIPLLPNSNGNGQFVGGFDDTSFTLGIGFCLTGGLPDNDNTNAATGVVINIGYLWQ